MYTPAPGVPIFAVSRVSPFSDSVNCPLSRHDYPQNRTAYAPLYVDIEGIADHARVFLGTRTSLIKEIRAGQLFEVKHILSYSEKDGRC